MLLKIFNRNKKTFLPIKILIILIFSIFIGCQQKSGDSASSTISTATTYTTYTSEEISRITTNMSLNIQDLQDLNTTKGLTESQYSYLTANVTALLTTTLAEVANGSVDSTRVTKIETAMNTEINRLGILTNSEVTVVRGQVNAGINSYDSFGLTTAERDRLIGIRTLLDEIQLQINQHENLNPYYVEIYNLYIAYFKEPDYNLNDNESLLNKIGVSLQSVDIRASINKKIAVINAELVELKNWAIPNNGYPDTFISELTAQMNILKTSYEAYTLGKEETILISEQQFRNSDNTLLNSYQNLESRTGSMELAYCNAMYAKVMALNDAQYKGYETEYARVKAVLQDFEQKRISYYNGDVAGSEDYASSIGNFTNVVSTSVNIISTYQYIKGLSYPFLN